MARFIRAFARYHMASRNGHAVGHVAPSSFLETVSKVQVEHAAGAALLEAYDRGEAKIVNGKLVRV